MLHCAQMKLADSRGALTRTAGTDPKRTSRIQLSRRLGSRGVGALCFYEAAVG